MRTTTTALLVTLAFTLDVAAEPIDFETLPGTGAPPFEGQPISDQYLLDFGVTFELENGTFPVIAETGNPTTAFSPNDNPSSADGPLIGGFFLTDDGMTSGGEVSPLIVSYVNPSDTVSGVVLDIDFDESFTIEARDINGDVLETLVIQAGDPDTGNRIATDWSIEREQADIYSLRFVGERMSNGFFGLGFDNFDSGVGPDQDLDSIGDEQDNCIFVTNPTQADDDGDGFGNACDADLDNNCGVDFLDLALIKEVFFTDDPVADFDASGSVDFGDLAIMKDAFFAPPGPSGAINICDNPSLVNFEAVPGVGLPFEGLAIGDQYLATAGVSFVLENGMLPVLAQIGAPATGFVTNDNPIGPLADTIGQFFLTDDGDIDEQDVSALIVSYAAPTATASGVVLDIDFDESFTIEARDAFDNTLESIVIMAGDDDTGDGRVTPWEITRLSADIFSLRFVGERNADGAFGLGFDNFEAGTAAPGSR